MYFISALPVAKIGVSLSIQISRAQIFLGVGKWTVCPSSRSNNSFPTRLSQDSSENRLRIYLLHSQRPAKNICCQLGWKKFCYNSQAKQGIRALFIYLYMLCSGAGRTIIGGANIHISLLTDCKNNRFQKKLITQNTNILIFAPPNYRSAGATDVMHGDIVILY